MKVLDDGIVDAEFLRGKFVWVGFAGPEAEPMDVVETGAEFEIEAEARQGSRSGAGGPYDGVDGDDFVRVYRVSYCRFEAPRVDGRGDPEGRDEANAPIGLTGHVERAELGGKGIEAVASPDGLVGWAVVIYSGTPEAKAQR